MKFQVDGLLDARKKFLGNGRVVYNVADGSLVAEKNPYENDYLEDVELSIRRLHFGDFGGLPLKFIYFILALITCFVIISGVLIWLEARNKKNVPPAQLLYNRKVGHIYLAICLALYPVTASSFIIAKWLPRDWDGSRETILYFVFFGTWLFASFIFRFMRDNYRINRYSLLLGSICALLIPIVNGFVSGNWIWKMYREGQYAIMGVDLLWLVIGLLSVWILLKMKRPVPKIDHQEIQKKAILGY